MYDLAKIWTPQTHLEWPCITRRETTLSWRMVWSLWKRQFKRIDFRVLFWWTVWSSREGFSHQQRELLPQLVFQQCFSPAQLPVAHTSICPTWSISLLSWVNHRFILVDFDKRFHFNLLHFPQTVLKLPILSLTWLGGLRRGWRWNVTWGWEFEIQWCWVSCGEGRGDTAAGTAFSLELCYQFTDTGGQDWV